MSSTVVYSGFMSCFEPQHTTTTSTALKLKLPLHHQNPEADHYSQDQKDDDACNNNNDHMMMSSNVTRLSPKSLELCTENLGSETGSDTTVTFATNKINHQEPSKQLLPVPVQDSKNVKSQKSPCDRNKKNGPFPPPLTTMSGASSLQVRRHRENGRLVIEAVERPLRSGVLQAERSGGRLRLSFLSPAEEGSGAAEEVAGSENRAIGDQKEFDVVRYQWMSRCKEGGRGGDNRRAGKNWNIEPALWVVTLTS